ncbi:DUF5695 domain-containing protein [Streptomyces sp. WG7]|uniref:DUF5695 domain-containing protein n=1 Tax=Streptomyces sp. WG7 TaxID=3417650 RepID=UPI003CEC4C82
MSTRHSEHSENPGGRADVSRRRLLSLSLAGAALGVLGVPRPAAALPGPVNRITSTYFDVSVDQASGGVFQLSNPQDGFGTNYVMNPEIHSAFDVDDSRWVGDMVFNVRKGSATTGTAAVTSLSDDIRKVTSVTGGVQVAYEGTAAHANGIKGFTLTQAYTLAGAGGNRLEWTIRLKNTSTERLEFQDVGFPLLMNAWWNGGDQKGIYEQNVGRHSFVGKDGSYIYWQRPNGVGPFLVMVPHGGTSLEFKNKARYDEGPFAEKDPSWEGVVEYFIHSKNISVERAAKTAKYLPATSLVLEPGAEKTYGFTFRWAADYADLRDVLHDAGVVDAISLPGMVVPQDTRATLAVRAKGGIQRVTGESGRNITVTSRGTRNGYTLYDLTFPGLGPHLVTVHYDNGRQSVLQYYSIRPIEELVTAHATFLATKQQARTTRGYNGAYLQWDMSRKKLITWDDYPGGGWKEWMAGGSDDLGLAPAAFLSEKNASTPTQSEVTSLDYYVEHFLLGYLQARTENGARTYQVYRWYDGQDGTPKDQGVWRAYNYVHIANTYLNMYKIAKRYSHIRTRLTSDEYLVMGYKTLEAMFTRIPQPTPIGDAAHDVGLMGEMLYPDILACLAAEGRSAEAQRLDGFLRAKRDRIFAQEYPFASEMSIDTTGFEGCYTLAKKYGDTALADKVTRASLAARGTQPLWYFYGSDNRHMGESWWNLGYECQLGAWQQQDYLYSYASTGGDEFDEMMRSTYGAYLAGWANINSGQISGDAANTGAASWQFQSEKGAGNYAWIPNLNGWWAWSGEADLGFWGGLRTATVNVVEDRTVGLYAYGGDVSLRNGAYVVVPKDGVRRRLALYNKGKFGLQIDKATYTRAQVSTDLRDIRVTLQSVVTGGYSPEITLHNLPAGTYQVSVDDGGARTVVSDGREVVVSGVQMLTGSGQILRIVGV